MGIAEAEGSERGEMESEAGGGGAGGGGVPMAEDQPQVLCERTVLPTSPEALSELAKKLMKANMFAKKRSVPAWESGNARSLDVAEAVASGMCGTLQVVGLSEEEWWGSAFAASVKRLRQV